MKSKPCKTLLVMVLLFLLTATVWLWWGNRVLTQQWYVIRDSRVPEAFDGFTIAQVSDLHNTEFGSGNGELLELLRQAQPDIIVITGDLIDYHRTDIPLALEFVRQAVTIAPCYYVTGNHDPNIGIDKYRVLESGLLAAGVHVLNDERYYLVRDAQTLTIAGIGDPVYSDLVGGIGNAMFPPGIQELTEAGDYTVLLCHRPEFLERYAMADVELVLTGHAHGGQIRLPLLGGLWAPNQGALPEYTSGLYTMDDTTMVVSRGLGNSLFPLRVNNPPEVVLVELSRG